MIADPKSTAFAENFAGQWLETRGLAAREAGRRRSSRVEPRAAAKTCGPRRACSSTPSCARTGRSRISSTAEYTFLNARLARHYGIEGVKGPDFRRVELDPDQRSGVFTHGSVLTVSSYPARTSPVLRGKYMLDVILGAPPPPPPADVPALNEEQGRRLPASLREQIEPASRRRALRVLPQPHGPARLRARELRSRSADGGREDGKLPIDVGGTLPNGKSFTTPARIEAAAQRGAAGVHAEPDREDADLRAGPGTGSVRPAARPRHRG